MDNPCSLVFPLRGLSDVFKKIKDEEKLEDDDLQVLTCFIDEFSTVSTHEATVGEKIASQVLEVNIHHHTSTCYKKGTSCRFGFPRPPAPHTIISKPVEGLNVSERRKLFRQHEEILCKVMMVVDSKEFQEEISAMSSKNGEMKGVEHNKGIETRIRDACQRAKVDYDDYVKALSVNRMGYKIVLQRDVDELYVNNYNVEWMRNWDANHDIQVAIEFFAVITYISNYYSKEDTAVTDLVTKAVKETSSTDYKEKMKIAANVFLKSRQIYESEAVYRLIPSLTLAMSNVSCQFVFTGFKEERSVRWIKASDEQLKSGIKVVQLDNQDGYFFEQQTMWDKYLRRPSSLEEISFAQFAKMYRSMSAKKRGIQADDDEEEVDSCDEELQTVEKVATSGKFDAKYFLCCNYTVHLLLKCCKCAAIQLHYFINVLK